MMFIIIVIIMNPSIICTFSFLFYDASSGLNKNNYCCWLSFHSRIFFFFFFCSSPPLQIFFYFIFSLGSTLSK